MNYCELIRINFVHLHEQKFVVSEVGLVGVGLLDDDRFETYIGPDFYLGLFYASVNECW